MPTPPIPGWKDPVATGMRCPIFREAFWPSSARICGCWRILVLLSLYRKLAVAGGMVTWKFVAFRCAKLLRLITPGWLPVVVVTDPLPVPTFEPDVDVWLIVLSITATETLVGGVIPKSRSLLRCTCMITTSTTTWDGTYPSRRSASLPERSDPGCRAPQWLAA